MKPPVHGSSYIFGNWYNDVRDELQCHREMRSKIMNIQSEIRVVYGFPVERENDGVDEIIEDFEDEEEGLKTEGKPFLEYAVSGWEDFVQTIVIGYASTSEIDPEKPFLLTRDLIDTEQISDDQIEKLQELRNGLELDDEATIGWYLCVQMLDQ